MSRILLTMQETDRDGREGGEMKKNGGESLEDGGLLDKVHQWGVGLEVLQLSH